MSKNTGGPAYPVTDPMGHDPRNVDEFKRLSGGMTLRDHFAGLAMQGLLASNQCFPDGMEGISRHSYMVADAMLAERKKGDE